MKEDAATGRQCVWEGGLRPKARMLIEGGRGVEREERVASANKPDERVVPVATLHIALVCCKVACCVLHV